MKTSHLFFSPVFATSMALLARASHKRPPPAQPGSLAAFHPAIARSWIAAASNKLLQPQHVLPSSRKLAWWHCPHCGHEHHKRIDLHVAAGGACPKCRSMPVLPEGRAGAKAAVFTAPLVKHRCRPDNSLAVLAAPNANRVKSSIADGGYLRSVETRNLQPMLARNYEKEVDKIGDDDVLFVSPKLDGVRCVVAWNAQERQLCFFSRSGTLFECCDHHIAPALRPLFEKDPMLVLDGELYNHDVDDFEQLVSAIRTTRDRRTPAVAKLQEQLQYHAFDVMYASKLPDMTTVPFSERYEHLSRLLATAPSSRGQCKHKPLVLVPAVTAKKAEIPRLLRLSMADGYEGVIVRRDDAAVVGYAHGARSPNMLKYKVMQDEEYVIVSGVEGRGKWKGRLGAFICRTKGGHLFTVAPATTEQTKKDMWHRLTQYKGKMLTVQYQELSANGVPRFPIGKCVRGAKSGKDWI